MKIAAVILLLIVIALLALAGWAALDIRAEHRMATALRTHAPTAPARFDPAMIADLPEPARRYLRFAIAPGTLLTPVASLRMRGTFRLGSAETPREMPMRAVQIHAAPHGFLWAMQAGSGAMRISGSDSADWTRFRVLGLIPVAHAGGTADHRRSALGRLFMEAAIWTPAAALPGPDVTWQARGPDTARVTFTHEGHSYAIDLTLAENGQPISALMKRWTNANPEKRFQLQPFGGTLSDFETFNGYTIPTYVSVGNFFRTDAYFPFFEAQILGAEFLTPGN